MSIRKHRLFRTTGDFFLEDPSATFNVPQPVDTVERLRSDILYDVQEWEIRIITPKDPTVESYYKIYRPGSIDHEWYGRGLELDVLYQMWKYDKAHPFNYWNVW